MYVDHPEKAANKMMWSQQYIRSSLSLPKSTPEFNQHWPIKGR
jgi:hypothetical protein